VLHENVAGDAVVEESKMLLDSDSGKLREVDVVITTAVAGQQIVIGVEATAAGRKATQTWVDSMLGKHASLPTDRLVLVSEAGFSQGGRVKAEAKRAIPLEPEDLRNDDAVGIVTNKLGTISVKFASLDIEAITISAEAPDKSNTAVCRGVPPTTPLFSDTGELICTVEDSVRADFDRRFPQIAKEIDLLDVEGAKTGTITLVADDLRAFQMKQSGKCPHGSACVRMDEAGGRAVHYWPVRRVSVETRLLLESGEIPLTHAKIKGLSDGFSFGEGSIADKKATFVVDESGQHPRGRMIIETDVGVLESGINAVIDPAERASESQ
jgi:hypothetical protein